MKQIPDFMIPSCASPFTEAFGALHREKAGARFSSWELRLQLGAPEGRRWLELNRAEPAAVTGAR